MGNLPVKYGLIAGGLGILFSLILYYLDSTIYLKFNSFPLYIIQIYFMVYVVSLIKKQNEGFITFNDAFKPAWLTYILSSTIIALFTYVLMNFINPSLIEQLKELQVEAFEAAAKLLKYSEEQKEELLGQLENANPYDLKSIAALPFSFLFPGAVIAVIIALIKRQNPIQLPN
jgi:hypothetical protein